MTNFFKKTTAPFVPVNQTEEGETSTKRSGDARHLDARNRARLYTARIWL